VVWP